MPDWDVGKIEELDSDEIVLSWADFRELCCNFHASQLRHDAKGFYLCFLFERGATVVRAENPVISHVWKLRNMRSGLMISNA